MMKVVLCLVLVCIGVCFAKPNSNYVFTDTTNTNVNTNTKTNLELSAPPGARVIASGFSWVENLHVDTVCLCIALLRVWFVCVVCSSAQTPSSPQRDMC